jgi:PAS domain S-box-containing protein
MATGFSVGGDIEQALGDVGVPSYVLDTTGVVRWINPAAERLVGDVRGRLFTSVVAPEDSRRARELFTRKVLGTSAATEATAVLLSTTGDRVAVEISSVPLMSGDRVVGVFGLVEERPDARLLAPPPHLTPRQVEVLGLLEHGPFDEADRCRASSEHRNGQEPHPSSFPGSRRQLPARGRRRRPDVSPLC